MASKSQVNGLPARIVLENSAGNEAGAAGAPLVASIAAQPGAANLNIVRQTSTASAATLLVARATRRSAVIRNLDAANSVWVGPATVTTANGFEIKAGESVPITWVGLLQIIDNGSHAAVAVADEYD